MWLKVCIFKQVKDRDEWERKTHIYFQALVCNQGPVGKKLVASDQIMFLCVKLWQVGDIAWICGHVIKILPSIFCFGTGEKFLVITWNILQIWKRDVKKDNFKMIWKEITATVGRRNSCLRRKNKVTWLMRINNFDESDSRSWLFSFCSFKVWGKPSPNFHWKQYCCFAARVVF